MMSEVRRVTIDPSGMFINDSEGRYAIVSWDDYGRLKDNELFGVPIARRVARVVKRAAVRPMGAKWFRVSTATNTLRVTRNC